MTLIFQENGPRVPSQRLWFNTPVATNACAYQVGTKSTAGTLQDLRAQAALRIGQLPRFHHVSSCFICMLAGGSFPLYEQSRVAVLLWVCGSTGEAIVPRELETLWGQRVPFAVGDPSPGRLYATRRAMSGTRHVSVQKSRPLNILWGQALTAQLAKDKSSWKRVSQPFFQALPHESSPRDRWTSPARGGVAELAEGKLKCIGSWRILNPRHCLPLTIHVATVSAVSDFERTDFVMFTL